MALILRLHFVLVLIVVLVLENVPRTLFTYMSFYMSLARARLTAVRGIRRLSLLGVGLDHLRALDHGGAKIIQGIRQQVQLAQGL